MNESPVDEYERRFAERRANAEQWLNRLCITFLAVMPVLVVFVFNWRSIRTSPYATTVWDVVFVVVAVAGALAASSAAVAFRHWPVLRPRWRIAAFIQWPAYVVYVIALSLIFERF